MRIRDKLNAAIEAWWASLPEDSKKPSWMRFGRCGAADQYRLGLLQYEKGAAQLAAGRASWRPMPPAGHRQGPTGRGLAAVQRGPCPV